MRRTCQDVETLPDWISTYGVTLRGLQIQKTQFGSGIVAIRSITPTSEPMLQVPANLILSLNYVWKQAKKDPQLKEVLESLGEFAKSARGAILTFLLVQISATSPDMPTRVGLENPWTTYVQYLTTETSLPTFWSVIDRKNTEGTTLAPAIDAKLKSLGREFELFKSSIEHISWCAKGWLHPETGCLTLGDWKAVDAIYRSRAMEIPAHGLCMVPVADMANHAHAAQVNSRTDVDHDTGDVRLALDGQKEVTERQQVTITYGEEKGACEMIFSYGFLDQGMERAQSMFLDMMEPTDDPIFAAKKHIFDCTPGFRIMYQQSAFKITWLGPYVWLMCINEEDGLELKVEMHEDGSKKLQASWKGQLLGSFVDLEAALAHDQNWDVFQLRAYSLVSARITEEKDRRSRLIRVRETEDWWQKRDETSTAWQNVERLRQLEWQMLRKADDDFEANMQWLVQSPAVRRYLNSGDASDEV